jgi:hypothetical protein
VTTFESSPNDPGAVTQATWEGPKPVAFVTIIGGTHQWPRPKTETGFDVTDAIWAFFARFLTPQGHAPTIKSQPHANVQRAGHPASFRVAATGDEPMHCQWQKNGKDVPGATSTWYTTPPAPREDDGAVFRVVVVNASGTAISDGSLLHVAPAPTGPKFTRNPRNQSVVAGRPATFSAAAETEPGLHYQWQKNGMDIAGATEAMYTIKQAITADSGATFRAVASNAAGSSASIPATLIVIPAPGAPVIVTNPARARLHPGETATFSVSAKSRTPMSYQWQRGRLTTNFTDIPGASSATYKPPGARMSDHRTLFRCIITNAAGAAVSASEMMLVTPAPAVGR